MTWTEPVVSLDDLSFPEPATSIDPPVAITPTEFHDTFVANPQRRNLVTASTYRGPHLPTNRFDPALCRSHAAAVSTTVTAAERLRDTSSNGRHTNGHHTNGRHTSGEGLFGPAPVRSLDAGGLDPATRPMGSPRRVGTPAGPGSESRTRAPKPIPKVQRLGRLPLQDEWVFETTIAELARIDPVPTSMIDLGAGPSRSLEIFMSSTGCTCSAVDSQGQMVAARIRSGANPQRNHVAQLANLSMFDNDQFELSFSRASLGWIADPETRRAALAEQVRIAERSLVINFDWSTSTGGPAFNLLRDAMAGVLEPMGFDPFYGAIQHAEIKSQVDWVEVETSVTRSFSRRFQGVVLASAKQILNLPTSSYRTRADELIREAQQEMDSGARFSLPAIVATHCRPV